MGDNRLEIIFPQDMIDRICHKFPLHEDQEYVTNELKDLCAELDTRHMRIPRCILFLSENGLSDFKENLLMAQTDWRDVIVLAEYENGIHVYNFNEPFDEANRKPGEKFRGPSNMRKR